MIVKAYWFYHLFLIPSTLKSRMSSKIESSLKTSGQSFPKNWVFIHNYVSFPRHLSLWRKVELVQFDLRLVHLQYQCCGMENKLDWREKYMAMEDIPFPYKKCNDSSVRKFRYGVVNQGPNPNNRSEGNGNINGLGLLWPASCCNNQVVDI